MCVNSSFFSCSFSHTTLAIGTSLPCPHRALPPRPQYAVLDEDIHDSPRPAPGALRRVASWLMPFSWSEYRWQFFSTFHRFAIAFVMTVLQIGIDLNSFLLLNILQIPVSNRINHARLLLIAGLAFNGVSDM